MCVCVCVCCVFVVYVCVLCVWTTAHPLKIVMKRLILTVQIRSLLNTDIVWCINNLYCCTCISIPPLHCILWHTSSHSHQMDDFEEVHILDKPMSGSSMYQGHCFSSATPHGGDITGAGSVLGTKRPQREKELQTGQSSKRTNMSAVTHGCLPQNDNPPVSAATSQPWTRYVNKWTNSITTPPLHVMNSCSIHHQKYMYS